MVWKVEVWWSGKERCSGVGRRRGVVVCDEGEEL